MSHSQASSPIGDIDCLDGIFLQKGAQLQLLAESLNLLQLQDALLLLRHSFAIPKLHVLYLLRTSPCFLADHLEAFDVSLHHLLSKIINVSLEDDSAWIQATLPVRLGGIGIRRAVQLAPSAYLASAAGCSDLIACLLPSLAPTCKDPYVESALTT